MIWISNVFIGPPDNDSMSESPEHLIRDGEYGNMARLETDKNQDKANIDKVLVVDGLWQR